MRISLVVAKYSKYDEAVCGYEELNNTLQLLEKEYDDQLLNHLRYDRCFETALCLIFPPDAVLLFLLATSVASGIV